MAGIDKIDYSAWTNQSAREIAQKVDKDGAKGLQGNEIFDFARAAKANNIEENEIYSLLGVSVSPKTRSTVARSVRKQNPLFDKAADYYNTMMSSSARSDVTNETYNNLTLRLYKMEQSINKAMQDCEAYSDISIVPRWHYRYYPYINTRMVSFDLDEVRTRTTKDMDSLYELRDRLEYIMEEANGETEHTKPVKTEYDVDKIAQQKLGMSYEEFQTKYAGLLEKFKNTTLIELQSMSAEDLRVYSTAKAYAEAMLEKTINEAQTTNWDIGERKLDETLEATGDMSAISEFEYDGITEEGLAGIKSNIMYKSFEETLINKYRDLDPTGIEEVKTDKNEQKARKVVVNGAILIFRPDGTVYDTAGRKVK